MKKVYVLITVLVIALLAGFALARQNAKTAHTPAGIKAAATIAKEKKAAQAKGTYNCCLKHDCDLCALHSGACKCASMVAENKPVCNECKGGWDAGDGEVPGKKSADIKTKTRG